MTIIRDIAETTEKQIKTVRKTARRSWLAGLGVAGMAMDTTEKRFNKYVKRGEKVSKEVRADLKKVNARVRREQENVMADVEDASDSIERKVTDVLANLNVPTRNSLRVLDTRIAQLNAQLRELNGGNEIVVAPVAKYDTLTAEEVNAVLPRLSLDELYNVEVYEARNQNRVTVLREVERQIAQRISENGEIKEPFAGYAEMKVEEVVAKLDDMGVAELHHVKLYESTHAKRVTVQREVERRLEAVRA